MKRYLIVGAFVVGAIAAGAGLYDAQQTIKTLESELNQARVVATEEGKRKAEHQARAATLDLELRATVQTLIPDLLSAYRNAAFAYVLVNREEMLGHNEGTSVLSVPAVTAADFLAPTYDGSAGQRRICIAIQRTHENQWALLSYTVGLAFSEEDLRSIADRLGPRSGWVAGPEREVELGDLKVKMPGPEAGECTSQPYHPVSATFVDLRHANLRL